MKRRSEKVEEGTEEVRKKRSSVIDKQKVL